MVHDGGVFHSRLYQIKTFDNGLDLQKSVDCLRKVTLKNKMVLLIQFG